MWIINRNEWNKFEQKEIFFKEKNHYIYKHLMKTRLYTHNLPNPDANNSGSIKSPAPENIINIL